MFTEPGNPEEKTAGEAREETLGKLRRALDKKDKNIEDICDILWETIVIFEEVPFMTVKRYTFCYTVKGYEIKISRKEKTITRATVNLALKKALEMKQVKGPKKLGVFGASYLYPMFVRFGIIGTGSGRDEKGIDGM